MKKNRFIFLGVMLVLGLALLTACGGSKEPTVVNVKLNEFNIELDKSVVPSGDVKFVITNDGTVEHELVLEPAGTMDEPFEKDGMESEAEDIEPGATTTLEWTLAPGDYHLGCYIEGHFEAGMETSFTVN
jgi:uncharacterized cupredoxin-like copper-binding protein